MIMRVTHGRASSRRDDRPTKRVQRSGSERPHDLLGLADYQRAGRREHHAATPGRVADRGAASHTRAAAALEGSWRVRLAPTLATSDAGGRRSANAVARPPAIDRTNGTTSARAPRRARRYHSTSRRVPARPRPRSRGDGDEAPMRPRRGRKLPRIRAAWPDGSVRVPVSPARQRGRSRTSSIGLDEPFSVLLRMSSLPTMPRARTERIVQAKEGSTSLAEPEHGSPRRAHSTTSFRWCGRETKKQQPRASSDSAAERA